MFRTSFIAFVSGLACLFLSSSVSVAPPPDPAAFTKLFVETIKKNDAELYVQTFGLTDADVEWMLNICIANPYTSENEKANIQSEFSESAGLKDKLNEKLRENFAYLQDWVKHDTINLNNIEVVDFYHDMEIKKRFPFYSVDNGNLYIKHGTKFYKIDIDDIAFINNQWRYGEIDGIEEVDKNLDDIYNESDVYSDSEYVVDSAVTYDTTVMVEPYYYEDSDYAYNPSLSNKQDKKVTKIQKKIDALYMQRDKILYKEE